VSKLSGYTHCPTCGCDFDEKKTVHVTRDSLQQMASNLRTLLGEADSTLQAEIDWIEEIVLDTEGK